jgi:hypothetical protein
MSVGPGPGVLPVLAGVICIYLQALLYRQGLTIFGASRLVALSSG